MSERQRERTKYNKLVMDNLNAFGCSHGHPLIPLLREVNFHSMIDVGSGNGKWARHWADMGKFVVAVDIAPANFIHENYAHDNIVCVCCSADRIQPIQRVDVVTSFDCMEHLPEQMVLPALILMIDKSLALTIINIHLKPEKNKQGDEQLHLTVKPMEWWDQKIKDAASALGRKMNVRNTGDPENNVTWYLDYPND